MLHQEYKRMMDQLSPREELVDQVLAQAGGADKGKRRRPVHKKKLFLALAAALVVMTGTAAAVARQLGVLELFFTGDTSQLEPYVHTAVDSAENGDYRLTVDSCLYDGQNIYAVITVTGLNDQAIEDLMSNKVIAETHRETWGESMVNSMMEQRSTGPDTFCYDFTKHLAGMSMGVLPDPDEKSRSWQISVSFHEWLGAQEEPFELWLDFMGRDCAVHVPLDTVTDSITLTPNVEVYTNIYTGRRGILKSFTLTPTSFSVETESLDGASDSAGYSFAELAAQDLFILRMRDGSLVTRNMLREINRQFTEVVDLTQVASVIYGDMEFPADGSEPFPAEGVEHLYPFKTEFYLFSLPDGGVRHYFGDVEDFCEKLGAEYTWDEDTQTATAAYRGVTVTLTVGSNVVLVDGETAEEMSSTVEDENGAETTIPMPVLREGNKVMAPTGFVPHSWHVARDVEQFFDEDQFFSDSETVDFTYGDVVVIP